MNLYTAPGRGISGVHGHCLVVDQGLGGVTRHLNFELRYVSDPRLITWLIES